MLFLQGAIRRMLHLSKGSSKDTGKENVSVISEESLGLSCFDGKVEINDCVTLQLKIFYPWLMSYVKVNELI